MFQNGCKNQVKDWTILIDYTMVIFIEGYLDQYLDFIMNFSKEYMWDKVECLVKFTIHNNF